MDDKGKELCPRLIDYLVVVGKRQKQRAQSIAGEAHPSHGVSHPELVRRYPTDDHKDFYLPTDVTVFCQPEGCSTVGFLNRQRQARDSQFFVFMLTEKDSAKIRYGICLNFFQCFEKKANLGADGKPIRTKRRDQSMSLTSLCLISHHPFVSIFHDLLVLLKRLIDACNHRAQQRYGYKDLVWSVLTGNWLEAIPNEVMCEIKELETWILMLLSSPVPVPGKTKVQLEVMPHDITPILEFALPDHTRFSLVDFPLHLPFELLGIDAALKVLTAVMLEYKVVLQSRNYNAVSMCVLSFVSLLYPLEYMFPVIPLLPAYMASAEQLLLAPTPFVIGVPASFFTYKKIKEVPNDVILVDLDSCQIHIPEDMDLPDLPEPDCGVLKTNLRNALNKMSVNLADHRRGSVEASYSTDADIVDVACRVAMVKFFNSTNVFANFSEHTRTLRLYPRPVVALQSESFLRSRPNCTQYINELCKTQAVEYFAECCLCPKNETFVRVQNGIDAPVQVGDKSKWFADGLMPVHFQVYPESSSLASAYYDLRREGSNSDEESEDEVVTAADSNSSIDDLVFDSPDDNNGTSDGVIASKPIAEVNDVYREPLTLELPQSESAISIGSSISSGRSSPSSSMSASAIDSEADFARLAENLALKSDAKGAFSFDHGEEEYDMTPVQNRKKTLQQQSGNNTPTFAKPTPKGKLKLGSITDSGEKVLGPNFMSAINGYAEKSQDIFSQVLNRTAPKAQALRDKTMRPLAAAAANRMEQSQHLVKTKAMQSKEPTSTQTANQQNKNQGVVREICDAVLAGQGVGVFTYPKLKRLMEDENLRELVCSKLNLGLDQRLSEDDFVREIQLTRAQYKGYVKVLQACLAGIDVSYNTPGSNGLASVFHVLEIAHTHYWSKENDATTPASGANSLMGTPISSVASMQLGTPSASSQDLQSAQNRQRLPATTFDMRAAPKPISQSLNQETGSDSSSQASTIVNVNTNKTTTELPSIGRPVPPPPSGPPPSGPPPLPPRDIHHPPLPMQPNGPPPPIPKRSTTDGSVSSNMSGKSDDSLPNGPPPSGPPPPLPPRPPPPRQESVQENSRLSRLASTDSTGSGSASVSTPASAKIKVPSTLPVSREEPNVRQMLTPAEPLRHYIYQDLILPTQNPLWQKMVFWENAFVDCVAQERDIIGMDQEPSEMIDRYSTLSDSEKKRLELEEDRLLSTLLHNLTAYMIMCGTGQKAIQQKTRRLLGKAHIGLVCSKTINALLDELPQSQGNTIPLKPLGSRLLQKQSFTVYAGSNATGTMLFMEVCDDAVVLRAVTGAVTERWWYERLVNMTYSPKTKVLCLWRRHEDKVHMHKFYTKKCRELYMCMKAAMERAAARGRVNVEGRDLGGEFPVHDTESNQGGLLQVRIDGVAILFANSQHFIELANIKKCNTFGGNVFVLEEYDRKKNELVQRRYFSQMARTIAWALHRVFSVRFTMFHVVSPQTPVAPPVALPVTVPVGLPVCAPAVVTSISSHGDEDPSDLDSGTPTPTAAPTTAFLPSLNCALPTQVPPITMNGRPATVPN